MTKALVLAIATIFLSLSAHSEWVSDTQGIMGTEVSVTLWHQDQAKGQHAVSMVMAEMRRIDAALSPYKEDSELSKINRNAYEQSQVLSQELAMLIDKSLFYSKVSNGAFDITFASLAQYYDYREKTQPNTWQREESLPAINYQWLEFDKTARTLKFRHEKVRIDLGGIAKGYAVDQGVAILESLGIEHASVSAGGDSKILGDRRGRPWVIGIKNPRGAKNSDETVLKLPLADVALSTSGDYERFFIDEQSGQRIHHILNPKTGHSAKEVMSVSVLGDRGADTDPLSTTIFVLGVEDGLALINKVPNFDAVIIDIEGKVHYSDGLVAGD